MYHPSLLEAPWRQSSVREVIECRPTPCIDTIYTQAAIWTAISTDRSLEMSYQGEGKGQCCCHACAWSQMPLIVNALMPTQFLSILIACLQPAAAVSNSMIKIVGTIY